MVAARAPAITGFRKEGRSERKGVHLPLQSLFQRPHYTWVDLSMGRTGHMVMFLPQAKRGDAIFKLDVSVPSWENGEFFFYSLPADCGVEDRQKRSKREARNPWEGGQEQPGRDREWLGLRGVPEEMGRSGYGDGGG